MSLETAAARYALGQDLRARVASRLRARLGLRDIASAQIFAIDDIEEAILAEREMGVCPCCAMLSRPNARNCGSCMTCLTCEF